MRVLSRSACALEGGGAFGALIALAPILALFLCGSALAEPAAPRNRCAAHGPDYVEVAGGGRCVRIGGHVRAETDHAAESAPPSLIGAPGGLARAFADGVKGVSETVQPVQPAQAPESRLYRR
jgi:hypothetical protein